MLGDGMGGEDAARDCVSHNIAALTGIKEDSASAGRSASRTNAKSVCARLRVLISVGEPEPHFADAAFSVSDARCLHDKLVYTI
jgi:hypothetical protein